MIPIVHLLFVAEYAGNIRIIFLLVSASSYLIFTISRIVGLIYLGISVS